MFNLELKLKLKENGEGASVTSPAPTSSYTHLTSASPHGENNSVLMSTVYSVLMFIQYRLQYL